MAKKKKTKSKAVSLQLGKKNETARVKTIAQPNAHR